MKKVLKAAKNGQSSKKDIALKAALNQVQNLAANISNIKDGGSSKVRSASTSPAITVSKPITDAKKLKEWKQPRPTQHAQVIPAGNEDNGTLAETEHCHESFNKHDMHMHGDRHHSCPAHDHMSKGLAKEKQLKKEIQFENDKICKIEKLEKKAGLAAKNGKKKEAVKDKKTKDKKDAKDKKEEKKDGDKKKDDDKKDGDKKDDKPKAETKPEETAPKKEEKKDEKKEEPKKEEKKEEPKKEEKKEEPKKEEKKAPEAPKEEPKKEKKEEAPKEAKKEKKAEKKAAKEEAPKEEKKAPKEETPKDNEAKIAEFASKLALARSDIGNKPKKCLTEEEKSCVASGHEILMKAADSIKKVDPKTSNYLHKKKDDPLFMKK